MKTNPIMVLDAAHNTSAALSLIKAIKELEENKIVFLLSMLSDKNHEEFISVLSGVAEKVVITAIPNERAANTKRLFDISKKHLDDVEVIEDYKEAYKYVNTLNKPVCITGSVYLIGHIKEILNKRD